MRLRAGTRTRTRAGTGTGAGTVVAVAALSAAVGVFPAALAGPGSATPDDHGLGLPRPDAVRGAARDVAGVVVAVAHCAWRVANYRLGDDDDDQEGRERGKTEMGFDSTQLVCS